MIHAVVFVPTSHLMPDAELCITYCLARGYDVVGVVRDDLAQAMEYLHARHAEVLVVADLDHIDPQSTLRIEEVASHPTGEGRRHRRTRVIHRDEITPPAAEE